MGTVHGYGGTVHRCSATTHGYSRYSQWYVGTLQGTRHLQYWGGFLTSGLLSCQVLRFLLSIILVPGQVAEIGGWLVTYGTINHMDKELDKDASASHSFLDQRSKLVEIKVGNPSARILSAADLSNEEKVTVKETKKTGFKAPKKSFMTLRAFRKRYPNKVIDPNSIKRL